jgi:hypothetical protein
VEWRGLGGSAVVIGASRPRQALRGQSRARAVNQARRVGYCNLQRANSSRKLEQNALCARRRSAAAPHLGAGVGHATSRPGLGRYLEGLNTAVRQYRS